jgi:LmeA-like phospholipid-binding
VRKLVVALVVLALLVVGADFGFRLWAESAVADRVDRSLGLPERPDVDFHGFPFSLQVLRSRFDGLDMEMEGLQAQGLVLDAVRLELHGVRFPRERLFSSGPATVRAQSGTGVIEVTDDDLTAYLQQRDVPVEVEFIGPEVRATATLSVAGIEVDAEATAELRLAGGALVFQPEQIEVADEVTVPAGALSFEVPLPQPFPGVRLDRLAVEEGVARIEGDLRDLTFRLRG